MFPKKLHLVFTHGIKGFVIPTKSFVKTGITKIFCYNNKMFSSINKTFGCCSKIFGCSDKKFICCPQFCCRNKTIFFRSVCGYDKAPLMPIHFIQYMTRKNFDVVEWPPFAITTQLKQTPFWGMLFLSWVWNYNTGVVRILVIFQARSMFSHIILRVLARGFHWCAWTSVDVEKFPKYALPRF